MRIPIDRFALGECRISAELFGVVLIEGTRTLMPAVREVIEEQGIFCALYSDRASHFSVTPKAGGKVDENQVTQLGRALKEVGTKMIPAYSPQARGRMERSYRTWQGRLPQELRAGIESVINRP